MEQLTIRHNTVNYGMQLACAYATKESNDGYRVLWYMQLACAYATKDSHISKQRSGMRGNHESYRENI